MVGIILGQYLECEEMLSRGLWPEFISDNMQICTLLPICRRLIAQPYPAFSSPSHTPSHPISCNPASGFPKLHQEGTEPRHHESEV